MNRENTFLGLEKSSNLSNNYNNNNINKPTENFSSTSNNNNFNNPINKISEFEEHNYAKVNSLNLKNKGINIF